MANKEKVAGVALVLVLVLGSLAIGFGPSLMRSNQAKRLAREGLAASATITALTETGNVYNDKPEIRIGLRVEPEGGEPFSAEVVEVLGPVDLQTYVIGARVPVHYDPNDPGAVALAGPPQPPAPPAPTTAAPPPDAEQP